MPSNLVDTTSFPLYTANALDQEHFLIAGGGGASKTGVPNMINVYKLTRKGKQLTATKVQQQDTGAQPVMNLDIHPLEHIIAAGMDNVCRLYHKPNIETTSDKVDKDGSKNTSNNKKGKGKKKQNKTEKEEIMPEMAVQQTAIGGKGDDEEYQKCVKFSRDGKFVITGASDGHVKIMQCPSLDIKYDIKAHTEEIDDLDVHPSSKKFVTVCRDCTSYLWRLDTGQKDLQLHFTPDGQEENSFKFRNCRFSHNTDENQVYMYTTHLPTKFPKNSPKPCNYLVKWDTAKWIPKSSVAIQKHSVTTLAVR